MMSAEKTDLPGLIEQRYYTRSELHGFEVDMYGPVIVPEFHPHTPDAVSAYINSNRSYSPRLMLQPSCLLRDTSGLTD